MRISNLKSFPANENPYLHDSYHMGVSVGKNIEIMFEKHDHNNYIIIVEKTTGERLKVEFEVCCGKCEEYNKTEDCQSILKTHMRFCKRYKPIK